VKQELNFASAQLPCPILPNHRENADGDNPSVLSLQTPDFRHFIQKRSHVLKNFGGWATHQRLWLKRREKFDG
jgi:hypothetical protein